MLPNLEHNKQTLSDYIDNVCPPLYNKFNTTGKRNDPNLLLDIYGHQ